MMNNLAVIIQFIIILFTATYPLLSQTPQHSPDYFLNMKGMYYLAQNKNAQAHTAFVAAIQLQSDNKYYHNNAGVACMKMRKYKQAYVHLRSAINLDKYYLKALSNMAIVCFHLGYYRKAHFYYVQSLSIDAGYIKHRFTKSKIMHTLKILSEQQPQHHEYKQMQNYLLKNQDLK